MVGRSDGRSEGNQLFFRPTRSDICRVYGHVSSHVHIYYLEQKKKAAISHVCQNQDTKTTSESLRLILHGVLLRTNGSIPNSIQIGPVVPFD